MTATADDWDLTPQQLKYIVTQARLAGLPAPLYKSETGIFRIVGPHGWIEVAGPEYLGKVRCEAQKPNLLGIISRQKTDVNYFYVNDTAAVCAALVNIGLAQLP